MHPDLLCSPRVLSFMTQTGYFYLDRLLARRNHATTEPGAPSWTSEVGCGGSASDNMRRYSATRRSSQKLTAEDAELTRRRLQHAPINWHL